MFVGVSHSFPMFVCLLFYMCVYDCFHLCIMSFCLLVSTHGSRVVLQVFICFIYLLRFSISFYSFHCLFIVSFICTIVLAGVFCICVSLQMFSICTVLPLVLRFSIYLYGVPFVMCFLQFYSFTLLCIVFLCVYGVPFISIVVPLLSLFSICSLMFPFMFIVPPFFLIEFPLFVLCSTYFLCFLFMFIVVMFFKLVP